MAGRVSPLKLKPVPVVLAPEIDTLVAPEFETVSVRVAVLPVVTLPKLRFVGDTVSWLVVLIPEPETGREEE